MSAGDFALLHGGGHGGWVWEGAVEALSQQAGDGTVRTLQLDVPGCGAKRGRNTDQTSVDDIATELVADIEAASMHDVVLVGHSQAGCILPRMVAIRPDLFRRLVYITCSAPLAGQTVLDMIGERLHGEDPEKVGWPIDPRRSTLEERFSVMFCNDMSSADRTSFMAKLGKDMWPAQSYRHTDWSYEHLDAAPATYVVCLQDNILPVEWQKKFAERFRCDRVVRIDAGHQAMITRPHGLAEILRNESAVHRSALSVD